MTQVLASLAVVVALAASPPWLERVFAHVQAGRDRAGAEPLERRAELDEAAKAYARNVANLPHSERLIQRLSIDQFLEDHGIDRFHRAKLHLDMGRGYPNWGDKFSRSWTDYETAWTSVTDPRYDAMGLGVARGDDDWVVLIGVLVDDLRIPTDLGKIERRALDGINEIRQGHGLGSLEHHDGLAGLARGYSEQMARGDFFSHTGDDGSTLEQRAEGARLRYRFIAENLHKSKGYDDPVPIALEGWMDSPGHRKNILEAHFTHSGVGVAVTEEGSLIFTQLFMLPLNP